MSRPASRSTKIALWTGGVVMTFAVIACGSSSTPEAKPAATAVKAVPAKTSATPAATTQEPTAAATETDEPETADPAPTKKLSTAQQNAVESAASYLDYSGFSRSGLIKQLKFEGFSEADATVGVDAQHANWNEQAVKVAKNYLDTQSFSRSGLIKQLKFEGFSTSQATYGVTKAGL